ncbi:heterokaryon incompatibility protein-domain-containing protein [Apiosordaria backusii]|uniref:Heterokaryon incompatibility protein-domain-containing protein n=1 Tax=Apiosordaria backusii TaxID=314023 RepID=A0AA40EMH7_9PEZI|nr:heterokaryon incompatibility protein-domain-containing protein [Apiosordaria backusii]
MRLINVINHQLEEVYGSSIPEYAILSHTWNTPEEATFQDWSRPLTRIRKFKVSGFAKIYGACKRAREDGIQYLWVDTVCIDKSSSAELSEAINSMYAWYEKAKTCYVYLSDVRIASKDKRPEDNYSIDIFDVFKRSRWWTRGWTLQELLAPTNVIFYSKEWFQLGTKHALAVLISEISGIDEDCLRNIKRVSHCSIAQRMSWASKRVVTREEDVAYSLLGIFGINMPLLYGEGSQNAFRRLQEEIIKVSDDQSVFAFDTGSSVNTLLAHHPSDFAHQSKVRPSFAQSITSPFTMSNAGLSLTTPLIQTLSPYWVIAVLNCVEVRWAQQDMRKRSIVCLPLLGRDNRFMRAHAPVTLITIGVDSVAAQSPRAPPPRTINNNANRWNGDNTGSDILTDNTSSVGRTTPLEIQDLTTRKETTYLVSYFSRIYPLYGNEIDEAMKGFAIVDEDLNKATPERGFMITFPRSMGKYQYSSAFPKEDMHPEISFFLPSAKAPNMHSDGAGDHGEVTRGILVFAHLAAGRFKPGFLGAIEIVGIYLALDSATGSWTCKILDLGRQFGDPDLANEWVAKGDEMVVGKPEEWIHYDQQQNVVVAARTRFETVESEPCREAIMVEIVFDLKELLEERELER